ncbi:hypothetical protein ACOSB0_00085, partial [Candidatus Phytoplasma citri]
FFFLCLKLFFKFFLKIFKKTTFFFFLKIFFKKKKKKKKKKKGFHIECTWIVNPKSSTRLGKRDINF